MKIKYSLSNNHYCCNVNKNSVNNLISGTPTISILATNII